MHLRVVVEEACGVSVLHGIVVDDVLLPRDLRFRRHGAYPNAALVEPEPHSLVAGSFYIAGTNLPVLTGQDRV